MNINEQLAKRLYSESPDWFKEELENEFGKEFFKEREWEKIKTFEDACLNLGIDPQKVISEADSDDEIAYKKLKIIIKAINQGWTPDWSETDQKKWCPWFNLLSGFGFDYSGYDDVDSATAVGSRLCFENEEKCDYAAQQFINIYREFLTIKNLNYGNKNKEIKL